MGNIVLSAPLVSGVISLLASLRSHGNANAPMVMTTADSIDELNPGFEKKLGKAVSMRSSVAVEKVERGMQLSSFEIGREAEAAAAGPAGIMARIADLVHCPRRSPLGVPHREGRRRR